MARFPGTAGASPPDLPAHRVSSAPKIVGSPNALAASAKRTTPYMPSWSVMASAARRRRAASSASSSGCDPPSRKLALEWQCSSAYETTNRPGILGDGGR
jgi:hypothetical protein